MSRVEVRERVRLSPLRARSLLTVRAAISSARPSETPRSRWESLTCSYWRARLVPFLTPRGGRVTRPPSPRDFLGMGHPPSATAKSAGRTPCAEAQGRPDQLPAPLPQVLEHGAPPPGDAR